jgi:hypothetical protein
VKYKLDSSSSDEQGDPDSSDTAQQNTKMGRRTDSAQHTSDSDAPENSGKERTKRSRAETTKDDSADDDHGDEDDSEEQEEIGNVESQNTNRKRDASDGEGASAESDVVNEGTESEQKTKRRRIQALSDEDSE